MKKERKEIIPTNPHNSNKRGRRGPRKGTIYVPPAQQEKMKEMFLSGKCISAIAKETGRDWKTVAKIVRSADMDRYIDECRAKTKELIPDILVMVQKEMQKAPNKDRVRVGIDFLTRAGIFDERQTQTQPVTAVQNVDSDEQERRGVREVIAAFTEIAIETHRIFGVEMPELETVKKKLDAGWQPSGNGSSSVIQSGHRHSSATSGSPIKTHPHPLISSHPEKIGLDLASGSQRYAKRPLKQP
jgi:hypothetical protein